MSGGNPAATNQVLRLLTAAVRPTERRARPRTTLPRQISPTAPRGSLVTNRSRDKGTTWESRVVDYLREHGWIRAERRARRGSRDAGDVAGVVRLVVECKAEKRIALSEYLTETEAERLNAGAALGVTWIKRPRRSSAGDGYVLMSGAQFVELLKAAGY
jgi:hypothetical protein